MLKYNFIVISFEELELPFIKVAATEIVSGVSGESEEKVRDTFQKAMVSHVFELWEKVVDIYTANYNVYSA